jgi:hypothetical protein
LPCIDERLAAERLGIALGGDQPLQLTAGRALGIEHGAAVEGGFRLVQVPPGHSLTAQGQLLLCKAVFYEATQGVTGRSRSAGQRLAAAYRLSSGAEIALVIG